MHTERAAHAGCGHSSHGSKKTSCGCIADPAGQLWLARNRNRTLGSAEPCGQELGRWITPFRRRVGRWLTDVTLLSPLLSSRQCRYSLDRVQPLSTYYYAYMCDGWRSCLWRAWAVMPQAVAPAVIPARQA